MSVKKIYSYKVKKNASKLMSNVLKCPQLDSRMDEKVCRITFTRYTIKDNIKPNYHDQCKNDKLYQIKVIDIGHKEFLVFQSLLVNLEEVIVTNE
jgi:hypothetical protein